MSDCICPSRGESPHSIDCPIRQAERYRPKPGYLLPREDPRVVAAITASRCLGEFDWRDIAEIVNAVLETDDRLAKEASEMNQTETTTKTVTVNYDDEGRVIREVTEVVVVTRENES